MVKFVNKKSHFIVDEGNKNIICIYKFPPVNHFFFPAKSGITGRKMALL
jgi:retron-type reverse transcriptase